MIYTITISDKKLTSRQKYEVYNDPEICGYVARSVREDLHVTLFTEDRATLTWLSLKYSNAVYDTSTVPFIPDIAISKTQISAKICKFDRHKGVVVNYSGVF